MSWKAMSWVDDIADLSLPVKFVLQTYARYANENWESWVSIEQMVRSTSGDRKTILAANRVLESAGYITRTDKRQGATNSIIVWKLGAGDLTDSSVRAARKTRSSQAGPKTDLLRGANIGVSQELPPIAGGPETDLLSIGEAGPNMDLLREGGPETDLLGSSTYPQADPEGGPKTDHQFLDHKNSPLYPPLTADEPSQDSLDPLADGESGQAEAEWQEEVAPAVRGEIGVPAYISWISNLQPIGFAEGAIVMQAPSRFVVDHVRKTHISVLFKHWARVHPGLTWVKLTVAEQNAAAPRRKAN